MAMNKQLNQVKRIRNHHSPVEKNKSVKINNSHCSHDSKKGVSFEFETGKNKGTRYTLLYNKELNIEL